VVQINNAPLDPGAYRASEVILSKATIEDNDPVHFTAGEAIELQAGFEVKIGGEFNGEINQCVSN